MISGILRNLADPSHSDSYDSKFRRRRFERCVCEEALFRS